MNVSGASVAGSSALSQQVQQSITHHTRSRYPSIGDVHMQSANAASAPSSGSPSGKVGRKVDISA
jgi:hypothetical protein